MKRYSKEKTQKKVDSHKKDERKRKIGTRGEERNDETKEPRGRGVDKEGKKKGQKKRIRHGEKLK